jgi:site-specific recombinase XerD
VSPEWEEALSVWLRLREKVMKGAQNDEGWLFISETGAQMDDHRLRKTLHSYLMWAGLPHLSFHGLRRFSLNRLAKNNLLAAQAIAGHKETKTTLLYTKLDPDFLREVHANVGVARSVVEDAKPLVVRRKRLV